MKKFMYLHFGFEPPTPEIMGAWMAWFKSIKESTVDMGGHFTEAKEMSKEGLRDLPRDKSSITGYTIIEAKDMDAAVKLAEGNPFISSIRICEIMTK